jgi:hypothetical protein
VSAAIAILEANDFVDTASVFLDLIFSNSSVRLVGRWSPNERRAQNQIMQSLRKDCHEHHDK